MIQVDGYEVQTLKEILESHYEIGDKVDVLVCIKQNNKISISTVNGRICDTDESAQPVRIAFDEETASELLNSGVFLYSEGGYLRDKQRFRWVTDPTELDMYELENVPLLKEGIIFVMGRSYETIAEGDYVFVPVLSQESLKVIQSAEIGNDLFVRCNSRSIYFNKNGKISEKSAVPFAYLATEGNKSLLENMYFTKFYYNGETKLEEVRKAFKESRFSGKRLVLVSASKLDRIPSSIHHLPKSATLSMQTFREVQASTFYIYPVNVESNELTLQEI